jgi:hypothetical protein
VRVAAALLLLCAGDAAFLAGDWDIDVACSDGHSGTAVVRLVMDADPMRATGQASGLEVYDGDPALAWSYGGNLPSVHLEVFRYRLDGADERRCEPDEIAAGKCLIADRISMGFEAAGPGRMRGTYDRWRWWGAAPCDVVAVRRP